MMLNEQLKSILSRYSIRPSSFGGEQERKPSELMDSLNSVSRHTRNIYYMACAMALILFLVMMFLTVSYRENWIAVTACFSALGATAIGVIAFVTRMAREMAHIGVMTAIASQLPPEQVSTVFSALLENEKQTKAGVSSDKGKKS